LLHLLGGLDRPNAGSIRFDGSELTRLSETGLSRLRNRRIGFVFQAYHLMPELDALENVCLPARMARVPAAQAEARGRELLARVGLQDRIEHKPYELSGGEQQRVAIARALANNPALLLADEPTGNLDSQTSIEIMGVFQKLNDQGITIIMVTHELDIARYTRRTVVMRDGKVVSDKPVEHRLLADAELKHLEEEQKAVQLSG
jgi:putative ABC transport system ATP-binding protein